MSFVDFSKAYDHTQLLCLWARLEELDMRAKLGNILQSLYQNVECCIRVNGVYTDWFLVEVALKQGCIVSPYIFHYV